MSIIEKLEKLIYEGFKETDLRFQETDRKFMQMSQETDRKFQETDLRFKETDRKFQELREHVERTTSGFDKLREEREKMDKLLTEKFLESKRMVDKLTGKWGAFVEGLVLPAVERLFSDRGIELTQTLSRARAKRNGNAMEIDILGVNKEYAVLVEAKSTLSVDDVDEHLERLRKFKQFFHQYKGYKVIGAVAGIVISESVEKYAMKKGLFVIAQSGESVKILNDEQFKPTVW